MATTAFDARADMLRNGPILSTLLRLSLPNLLALLSAAIVSIAETAYVGSLGVPALGGIALVFPIFMLMQMLSAGAMGGTVSGAVSRALGSGDTARADAVVLCTFAIALGLGGLFTLIVRLFGDEIYRLLGGSGAVLAEAMAYSHIAAFAIVAIWISNLMAAVVRGSGVMAVPSSIQLGAGVVQVIVGGTLGLGIGPFPQLGMAGVAWGLLFAFSASAIFMLVYLQSTRARLRLRLDRRLLRTDILKDIFRIGAVAMLSPLFSVSTILILTGLVARFGADALAGFGIGVRLEFLLIPIAFSVGVACVPMVGVAIGGGDVPRARQVAWSAGGLAALVLAVLGLIAVVVPELWVNLFTDNLIVREAGYDYLHIAGFAYGFFGLGLCLYFASQGAGRVGGAISAQALRLGFVLAGGWALVEAGASLSAVFILSALSMAVMGLSTALFLKLARW
jgi:putative MATE family efflux protein